MKTLSLDLRERIVAAVVAGGTVQEVADRFCVSHDSVRNLKIKHEAGQSLEAKKRPGRSPRLAHEEEGALEALVQVHPDATLEVLCVLWNEQKGLLLPKSTMHDALHRVKARFKKNMRGQRT